MPRFYVKNKKDKWNIYSTIVDDLLFEKFVDFEDLKIFVIQEIIGDKEKELNTLLTEQPILNNMLYDDCIEKLKLHNRKIPKE